ncbi:hypothetical protein MAR_035634 [Mya arenaria]|uniref:Uncharacterized protein n=1 Tax=Mya arenaria TaxID=6604 RepID=A0ABY7EKN5_MYAAR|nr:hypothetical protein MAR_035634 [Mya arenaria]
MVPKPDARPTQECATRSEKSRTTQTTIGRWLGNQKELKQWEEVIAANFNHKREVKDLRSPENKLNDTHDINQEEKICIL